MSIPNLELQGAMVVALRNGITVPGDRVYDQPPAQPVFPYVVIGDCQALPDAADCIDGSELFPIIDVWSRSPGYPEAKRIAQDIVELLDGNPEILIVPDYDVIIFDLNEFMPLRDPDGLTRRVRLTFHAFMNFNPVIIPA